MKLLIQHTHHDGEIAGALTYIREIEPALNLRGVETRVISTRTTSVRQWIGAIATADLIHMNSNHSGFALLCKLFGKKIIIKYHYLFYLSIHYHYEKMSFLKRLKAEFMQMLPKAKYPLKWKLYTVVKWTRFGVRFLTALLADRHTACSQFLAESHSFPWKVSTVFNPISVAPDQPVKTLDSLICPYTFTYVGRVSRDKGIDLLIKAAKLLQNWGYEFRVLIIGDGRSRDELKLLADNLLVCDRIDFLGSRDRQEILNLVESSLALVVPSRWQEPAGYVTLEASSVQTCSIVANVGGLPEMASPCNLMFEREDIQGLAEAMKTCLDNPKEAIERGKKANQYITEQFSPHKIAQEFLDICNELKPSIIR
ncbi:glycosyltransferase family 4 protein [Myxacorys almedinensis]|uniref:Glycosyltransferase n=1 Tax=Myxacorys almedinensis A TaxID=2690445 RepID=A0A8J7Z043_9CYAN|nr:glycosyltransferase [Myxacorys almedinensis]NDJ15721.1 glycosyltransferase [Myxacorys almedinensis A]